MSPIFFIFSFASQDETTMNIKNMKRESKVYSYKEQQEEIALRKELEEKKRKEGKVSWSTHPFFVILVKC